MTQFIVSLALKKPIKCNVSFWYVASPVFSFYEILNIPYNMGPWNFQAIIIWIVEFIGSFKKVIDSEGRIAGFFFMVFMRLLESVQIIYLENQLLWWFWEDEGEYTIKTLRFESRTRTARIPFQFTEMRKTVRKQWIWDYQFSLDMFYFRAVVCWLF